MRCPVLGGSNHNTTVVVTGRPDVIQLFDKTTLPDLNKLPSECTEEDTVRLENYRFEVIGYRPPGRSRPYQYYFYVLDGTSKEDVLKLATTYLEKIGEIINQHG